MQLGAAGGFLSQHGYGEEQRPGRGTTTARGRSVRAGAEGDANVFGLGEEAEGFEAAFAADAAGFDAAEGRAEVADEPAVDPHDAGLYFGGDAVGALEVGGPDGGCQAVLGGVSEGEGFFFGVEGLDGDDGAKNFLLVGSAGLGEVGNDGGGDKKAVVVGGVELHAVAAAEDFAAFFLGEGDVGEDFVEVGFAHDGAYLGGVLGGVAHAEGADALGEGLEEAGVQGALHKYAAAAEANLALVGEGGTHGGAQHFVEVAVREDDVGVFAAQLQAEFFEEGRGLGADFGTGYGAAGEGNDGDVRVGYQGLTEAGSRAVDDVQNAVRQAGVGTNLGQEVGGDGRDFRGFGHHGVARCEGWGDLPSEEVEREVPRADAGRYANGATQGVVEAGDAHVVGFRVVVEDGGGVEGKVVSGARDVHGGGQLQGFAVVFGLGRGQFVQAGGDAVGNAEQDAAALGGGEAGPGGEGCFGSGYGTVHVVGAGIRNSTVHFAGGRLHVLQIAAGGGFHEGTVDPVE